MANITGGCLCGAVRYASTADPIMVRACWCRVCQYFASGNATVNVVFPKPSLTLTGELHDYASTADSGSAMHRRFCPSCGVHVFSESEQRPHLVIVRAGTLDDPSIAKATAVIWCASAPDWAQIDPALQQFAGQPPAASSAALPAGKAA
jgi:hypothetical protein